MNFVDPSGMFACAAMEGVRNNIDGIQLGLDAGGFIPVIGIGADALNASIDAARGDWALAGVGILSAVPLAGDSTAGVAKATMRAARIAQRNAEKTAFKNSRDVYAGVKEASQYLKDMGITRNKRKNWIQSFDIETIKVRNAGNSEFGIRYYDNINAPKAGRFLFDTFPASRKSLAVKEEWNKMSHVTQWQIKAGALIIEGKAASQGFNFEGGKIQKFILNPIENLLP